MTTLTRLKEICTQINPEGCSMQDCMTYTRATITALPILIELVETQKTAIERMAKIGALQSALMSSLKFSMASDVEEIIVACVIEARHADKAVKAAQRKLENVHVSR